MPRDTSSGDWIRRAAPSSRVERIEAYFGGHGYDMHRHDTYAIGRTLSGVQSFHYRRGLRHSLPGGTIVLHPDEAHDGQAGTDAGFRYRMIYVEPALIQQILGGRPLPFIRDGISADPRLYAASAALLQSTGRQIDPLQEDDALFELAHALCSAAGRKTGRRFPDYAAADRARHYIHASLDQAITLDDLARAAQTDRWSLSRAVRHQPLSLRDAAAPGSGPPAHCGRPSSGAGRRRRGIHRSKPHDAPARPGLRHRARSLAAHAAQLTL